MEVHAQRADPICQNSFDIGYQKGYMDASIRRIDEMKLLKDMIKIDRLSIWELPDDKIGVSFENFAEIKKGDFLMTEFGEGTTLENAVRDYARKISGRTLVANPTSSSRREITVLFIGEED